MNISIKELFEYCEKNFDKEITSSNNEVIKVSGISIKSIDNRDTDIIAISKHYVTKDKYRITIKSMVDDSIHYIDTTDDHTCIRITEDWYYERVKASQLKIYENVPLIVNDRAHLGLIISIDILGPWNDYVYDLEVDDESHTFYANNILIHNSQFINIAPIVDDYISRNNLSANSISELNQDQLDTFINELDNFIYNDVNVYIKNLINSECHTTQGGNLKYSREYVTAQGMFFKKKHYIVHLIKKDDKTVDVFKYSGVSCKKTEIPADMKYFLKTIFEDTCIKDWKESDYRKYIDMVFNEFLKKSYEDISLYKSYSTEKACIGFMISEKGTGAHARAANIYNQLLDDLHIGHKYEKINLGDQLRYCYIHNTNPYGIDVIAFKEYFPEEFKTIFTINYDLMFEKIFLSSLKGYIGIMKFNEYSPNNKSICDISDL